MELKEGMYVRFDWKKQQIPILIGKITEVNYDEDEKYYFYLTDNGLVIGEDNLVKEPSYNIIDLIEVGDYVNGYKVYSGGKNHFDYILTWDDVENYYMKIPLLSLDIKSIVTKEVFANAEYKVETN